MTTTVSRDYAEPPDPDDECIFRIDKVIQDDDRLVWSFTIDQGPGQGEQWEYFTSLQTPTCGNCAIF
jgi:hypothetical protein